VKLGTFLTTTQISHRLRWLNQRLRCPTVGIIGGYHGGNLGDMTLGTVCREFFEKRGVRAGLQTIYSLPRWPACRFAILGGGAIAYRQSLRNIREMYGKTPERVAFVGVDFNEDAATEEFASFLRQVAAITCRSRTQAEHLRALIQRPDVGFHPDLAFGLDGSRSPAEREVPARENVLGVNCTTFFWKQSGGRYVPGSDWEAEMRKRQPKLVESIDRLGPAYVRAFTDLMALSKRRGWRICHGPFTPEDDEFARHFFSDQVDEFLPYAADPRLVLQMFGRFSAFLPTRFHSLVFALLSRTPVIPFCYAEKSQDLLDDLGPFEAPPLTAHDLLKSKERFEHSLDAPIVASDAVLCEARRRVFAALESAAAATGICSK
jgi:hypothetical protein